MPPIPSPQDHDYLPPETRPLEMDRAALSVSIRWPMLAGIAVIALIVLVFGVWAATAPLAGGTVAPGVVSPEGSRRTVSHREGGIIAEIMVSDGDVVDVGAPLLRLEDTQARAAHEALLRQTQSLRASIARLNAEQLGHDGIDFPEQLLAAQEDDEVEGILAVQKHLFATRREARASRKSALEQRILQIRKEMQASEAQLASVEKRLALVNEDLEVKERIYGKRRPAPAELLAARRTVADIEGERGALLYAIAETRQKLGETETELVALDAVSAEEIAAKLDQARAELARVENKLAAGEDVLRRATITAPISGTVANLRFTAAGTVLPPNDAILDIVPAGGGLLVDARVAPTDIGLVYPGLPAQVHLTTHTRETMPRLDGTVRSVSPAPLQDAITGMPYYLARIEVDPEQLSGPDPDVPLTPGTPAQVLIVTSERTLFGYLLKPFSDIFRRSLREA